MSKAYLITSILFPNVIHSVAFPGGKSGRGPQSSLSIDFDPTSNEKLNVR